MAIRIEGQEVIFPALAKANDQLPALVEKTVRILK